MTGPVLVTGASGQVGAAVVRLLGAALPDVPVAAPGRAELDLLDTESIRGYVGGLRPRWIVSCAAYTAVDAAEQDAAAAFAANGHAPGVLAEEAAKLGAGLVHVSTDYVFNGSGQRPWVETDSTDPLNVYGASKLQGERAIASVAVRSPFPHAIVRTSWVYSDGGKNFVRTMLRLLATRTEPLRIVADQHGAPTAAADIAGAIVAVLRRWNAASSIPDHLCGIFHCAGAGETTWAGLAGAVQEYLRTERGANSPDIIPVSTADYPTPAARPLNSRLNCDRLAETFGVHMPNWRTSLPDALRTLAETDLPGA